MRNNPGPGKFIVIEGLDGVGSTTQAERLAERLAERGPAWRTQEPTERPAGQLIRRILTHDWRTDPRCLALLFAADRVDHVYHAEGILSHLQQGIHVVCDRYYLSSMAYQTLDAGSGWVYRINDRVLRPDLVVLIEVPVQQCLQRIGIRQGERKELFEEQRALERVRAGYYRAIRRVGLQEAVQVVDGSGSIEAVAALLWSRAAALFEQGLLTRPAEQRRLARVVGAGDFPRLQELLLEDERLWLAGLRRLGEGLEALVHSRDEIEPLRLCLRQQEEGWTTRVEGELEQCVRLKTLVSRFYPSADDSP
ncbi:MAG: dTMP kinase [Chloroflexia bacterium]|nr:dTMP kinase [Chloroflexia bacterium]